MNVNEPVTFDLVTQKNIDLWLNGQYDEETKSSIYQLLREDPKQAIDAFFTNLTFGTGGLRGIMGVGTNRMNNYTVRAATQGLANYIRKQEHILEPSVFIGYDSRHYSRKFAEEAAKVLAGNGIRVYLTKEMRPTPLVSFGCRYLKCTAAIMITASHNPAEYNGYKVYWSDGGQLTAPHDTGVIAEALQITDPTQVKKVDSLSDALIQEVGQEIDQRYIETITPLQNFPEDNKKFGHELKIVYTSLHGTGITLAPAALAAWGFNNVGFVEKQIIPDGSFPTTKSPNPESPEALKLGIDCMLQTKSDLLIATDPDADRMGVAFMHEEQALLLNGNQILAICLEHICEALTQQNRMPEKAAFIKSIVTTELFQAICDAYKKPCFNVLTGFKYIAAKMHEWECMQNEHQYVFGGEESYGSLLGTYARDKDAIIASALIAEVALQAKLKNKTLLDKLYDLYHKYGIYQENLLSINFGETKEGKEQMVRSMQRLRDSSPSLIDGIKVVAVEDYQILTKFYLESGKTEAIQLPPSDVLSYWLEDGSKVMVRPSGTEPKVKIYCGVVEKDFQTIAGGIEKAMVKCDRLLSSLKEILMNS